MTCPDCEDGERWWQAGWDYRNEVPREHTARCATCDGTGRVPRCTRCGENPATDIDENLCVECAT